MVVLIVQFLLCHIPCFYFLLLQGTYMETKSYVTLVQSYTVSCTLLLIVVGIDLKKKGKGNPIQAIKAQGGVEV
jgi:hypothetical protein